MTLERNRGVHPLRLLMWHTISDGYVDPEVGRWYIPHMYSEGLSYHE